MSNFRYITMRNKYRPAFQAIAAAAQAAIKSAVQVIPTFVTGGGPYLLPVIFQKEKGMARKVVQWLGGLLIKVMLRELLRWLVEQISQLVL